MYSGKLWAYKNGEHLPQSGEKETSFSFKTIVLERKSGVLLLKELFCSCKTFVACIQ